MNVPILLMAFNRPKLLKEQFMRLENLSPREVTISIDGSKGSPLSTVLKNKEVADLSSEYQKKSRHNISIIYNSENLGLMRHFKKALGDFFALHETGIIIEDDIIIHKSFFELVDKLADSGELINYWSVCAFNPKYSIGAQKKFQNKKVKISKTYVHTIWGWAAHRKMIYQFLDFCNTKHNIQEFEIIFQDISKKMTYDQAIRGNFKSTWIRKTDRALKTSLPNWDNFWVIAGWQSKLPSLMAEITLSNEAPSSVEGQTHIHKNSDLILFQKYLNHDLNFDLNNIKRIQKRNEIEKLKVWGIGRRYAWFSMLIGPIIRIRKFRFLR